LKVVRLSATALPKMAVATSSARSNI